MYDRLKNEDEEALPDEIEMKENKDNANKESGSLSAADTQGNYGSTPVQDKSGSHTYVPCCGLTLYTLLFCGGICVFSLRTSLNEAMVAMVNQTIVGGDVLPVNFTFYDQCPRDAEDEAKYHEGVFNWNRQEQSAVLAAFYFGMFLGRIPGGWLADRFGGRWFCGCGLLVSSVVSLLTPTAASIHIVVLVLLRILAGICEGPMPPSVQTLLARWSQPKYRSIVISVNKSGIDLGAVVGMLVAGILCDFGFAGGWPSVFYVFGMAGCLWCIFWFLFCYSSPSTHPWISKAERQYWENVLGTVDSASRQRTPAPWSQIFTSIPVWALAVATFSQAWGFTTIQTCMPMFMYDVLGFNSLKNGVVCALPYLALCAFNPLFGFLTDWLRSPGRLSTKVVRKAFIVTGFAVSGVSSIFVCYTDCSRILACLFFCLAVSGSSMSFPNIIANVHDLSPPHAGILIAVALTAGSLAQVGGPLVVGEVTQQHSTYDDWQIVFYICAAMYAIGAAVFVIFGSTERQSWAEPQKQPETTTK